MTTPQTLPRLAARHVRAAIKDSPVVLVFGPRQSGKSTLVQYVGAEQGYVEKTFDHPMTLAAARADPVAFIENLPPRVILDEIQRVPELMLPIKAAVDRDRRPGRFLLTGSTNILLLPKLGDSLAGRMDRVRLHPLAQCELASNESGFLDQLFAGRVSVTAGPRLRENLTDRVVAGGYLPAIACATPARRSSWYINYIDSLIQRDVKDIANISQLESLPRLLTATAICTSQLLNITNLGNDLSLSRPTIRTYLTLLERLFLVDELPAWHSNKLTRLVKSPKLHLSDSGMAAALLSLSGEDLAQDRSALGPLLETFVYNELQRLASGRDHPVQFHHFRDKDGVEVDLVLEQGPRKVAGVEVKAGATVTDRDFAGLRAIQKAAGDRFTCGVVFYDGEEVAPFGHKLFAVPYRALWEPPRTSESG